MKKQYIAIAIAITFGYRMTSRAVLPEPEIEAPPEPPRNFTISQLRYFDGGKDPKFPDEDKPLYLSVNTIVFDVSNGGRDFYGPNGPYEIFAGRECGIALAKMSFDEEYLDRVDGNMNFGERQELDGWIQKFQYYRNYPIIGRLILDLPDPERIIARNELSDGTGEDIPEGYATAPIHVAVDGNVFDMSFGGVTFYGKGGPYQKFAGNDATRALSLMKIEESGNTDLSDLTEKQLGTMREWVKTFREKKQYPIVGKLQSS